MGAASGQLGVDDISIELKNASAFMCLNLSSDDNVLISQIRLTAPYQARLIYLDQALAEDIFRNG